MLCITILAMIDAGNGRKFTKDQKGLRYLGEISGTLEAAAYSLLISLI